MSGVSFIVILLCVASYFSIILWSGEQLSVEADVARLETVPPNFEAMTDFFTGIAEDKGAVYAYELMRVADLPPNVDVHLLGHTVGGELYKQQGLEGMKYCTQDFRNACSHSIVIGALLENGLGVFDEVNDVCKQAPGGSGAYTMCFHGFGHGVLAYAEYDFEKAVELCMRAGTSEYHNQEANECIGGAVMEMKDGIHDQAIWKPQKAKFVDPQNPLSLCQADYMPEGAKERCYSYITPFLFEATGDSNIPPDPAIFSEAMAFCETEPNPVHRLECYAGFGKEYIVFANDLNVQTMESISNERLKRVLQWCGQAPEEDGVRACVLEVVNSLYWGGENDYHLSIRYCSLFTDHTRSDCFNSLYNNALYYYHTVDYLNEICASVSDDEQSHCQETLLNQ